MADLSNLAPLLRLAAFVCVLEAAALVALGFVELDSLHSGRLEVGITTAVFFFLYALALLLGARGLARARSWTRAPLLLAQLIQLGLAWGFHGTRTDWITVLLAVPALFVAVVLLLPATTRPPCTALRGRRRPDALRTAR